MEAEEIDLRHYVDILWKWKWVVIFLTAMAVVTSGIFSYFVLSPIYETKVTVLVTNAAQNQQSIRPSGDGSVVDTVSRIPTMTLNTYMSQLQSPYFMKRIIDKLGLVQLSPAALTSMVNARIIRDTNLIEVRVQNQDKHLATQIANTIATEFTLFVSETNQERMAKSLAFLTDQRETLRKDLETAYAELKQVLTSTNNASSLSREISTKTQVITSVREELVSAQTQKSTLEAGLAQIEKDLAVTKPTIEGTEPPTPNPVYQDLLQSKSRKTIELAEVNSRINALSREISSLEASLSAMERQLTEVKNQEDEKRANVKRLEDTLSLLDSKTVETQMAQSINFGDTTISIVSPALEPSSPVKPRKVLNMAIAAVLGGFLSIILAFILEYLDNTIKTREDVEKHLHVGTLGAIPVFETEGTKDHDKSVFHRGGVA